MASAMHLQIAPSPCMVFFFFQNKKTENLCKRSKRKMKYALFFLNGCTHLLIFFFEEINFLQSSHTKHLDVVTVSQENLRCSLANVRYSTYMAWLSLPTFVSCAITHYANAHFVSIDPNALTKNSIHILRSETKPPRL